MNLRTKKVGKAANESPKKETALYGFIPGIEIGNTWKTRQELSASWVHRPKAANLHAGPNGVYSILINSKYRGQDNGFTVVYSGLRVKGKSLYSDTLVKNCTFKRPIRVIRAVRKNSRFAPESGFRFDGLYIVEKYRQVEGHVIFSLSRDPYQSIAPWLHKVGESQKFYDDDFSPYTSHIRDQLRTKREIIIEPKKADQDNELEEEVEEAVDVSEELDDTPSMENTAAAESSLAIVEAPLVHVQPVPVSDKYILPQMSPPEQEDIYQDSQFEIGEMLQSHIVKEEGGASGSFEVRIEHLPQEYTAVNGTSVYKEETTEVIQTGSTEGFEEKIEIGSTSISYGRFQMLTTESLSTELNNTCEIDIEDGPKYSEIIDDNLFISESDMADHPVATEAVASFTTEAAASFIAQTEQNAFLPAIKNDFIDYKKDFNEELEQTQEIIIDTILEPKYMNSESNKKDFNEELEQTQEIITDMILEPRYMNPESNKKDFNEELEQTQEIITDTILEPRYMNPESNVIVYCPDDKFKNVDEAEKAILTGRFLWYPGGPSTQQQVTRITSEYEENLVVTVANSISDQMQEERTVQFVNENLNACQQSGCYEQPDSTSQLVVNNSTVNQCSSGNHACPYSNITMNEVVSFTVNRPLDTCLCTVDKNLPCLKYCADQILLARAREANKPSSSHQEKQIMAAPSASSSVDQRSIQPIFAYTADQTESLTDTKRLSENLDSTYDNTIINLDELESSSSEAETEDDPLDFIPEDYTPLTGNRIFYYAVKQLQTFGHNKSVLNLPDGKGSTTGVTKKEKSIKGKKGAKKNKKCSQHQPKTKRCKVEVKEEDVKEVVVSLPKNNLRRTSRKPRTKINNDFYQYY